MKPDPTPCPYTTCHTFYIRNHHHNSPVLKRLERHEKIRGSSDRRYVQATAARAIWTAKGALMKVVKRLIVVLLAGIPLTMVCAPPENNNAVHVLFGLDDPEKGIFPSDIFAVADDAQKTGLRVNLPVPGCAVRASDCADLALINVLDGFNLQPRVTVPFDGDIDPQSVNSTNAFFLELAEADIDAPFRGRLSAVLGVIGVNQLVWDAPAHVLAAQPDQQLRQHTRYAFVITTGLLDASGAPVKAAEELDRFRHDLNFGQTHDPVLDAYRKNMLDAFEELQRLG